MIRISQLNWPRILLNRRVAVLLGVAAVLSVATIAIIHSDINPSALSPLGLVAISVIGVAGVLGYFVLLICMGFFWLRCDFLPRRTKAVWLVLLLVGWGFGSQIAYYILVYLPTVIERTRNQGDEVPSIQRVQVEQDRGLFGPFGWALVVGWSLLFLTVAACFIFPKGMSHVLGPFADFFVLWPASLLIATLIYAIVLFFRVGMRVAAKPLPQTPKSSGSSQS